MDVFIKKNTTQNKNKHLLDGLNNDVKQIEVFTTTVKYLPLEWPCEESSLFVTKELSCNMTS